MNLRGPMLPSLPKVNFPVALAPMVGLSHSGLRFLVRHYMPLGAQTFWPTEMLNSRRLPHEAVGRTEETLRLVDEDHLVPQLLGNEEKPITDSVRKLEEWGAVGVDINMGCPVAKALRHNYGVALMGNSDYAAAVVEMAKAATSKPVSVKMRAGLDSDRAQLREFLLKIEGAGADWITLHPRLSSQKRRGRADWQTIRFAREVLRIPVVGNGDVQTADDVFRMREETGCSMVMVGRALVARPWLMWQVGEALGFSPPLGVSGRAPRGPTEEAVEYGRSLVLLLSYLASVFPESKAMKKFLFHVKISHVWLKFGHALWAGLSRQTSVAGMQLELRRFFSAEQEMAPTTDLRE